MIVKKNEVLLLKLPSTGEDKYKSILTENDFSVKYLEVLEFVFINLSNLTDKLMNADNYGGLVFTSPRSVIATKMALDNQPIDERWQCKCNFVVGEYTFDLAKKELGLMCKGKDSGNANNLADIIISDSFTQPLLFPCGNLKKETLGQRLKEHNIEIDPLTVYETKKNHHLIDDFNNLTSHYANIPEYVVFFSPSGVHYAADIFKKCPLEEIKLIAIGPSTEKALKDEHLPVYSVASKPTHTEVLNAVLNKNENIPCK